LAKAAALSVNSGEKKEGEAKSTSVAATTSAKPLNSASAATASQKSGGQVTAPPSNQSSKNIAGDDFPHIDRIHQLFSTKGFKLPIVDTVTYNSRVEWLKGRPAWIADYAAHYATSRHFIARSLNGKLDYFSQKVSTGSRFNVFRTDKDIQFYLLVDVSRCKMGLYYFDKGTNERVLLKTYSVGLGRFDPHSPSGRQTPLGLYSLGNKIAIYQPGTMGLFMGKSVEMMQVYGTRWIPFGQEIEHCTAPAKGIGLHGLAFVNQSDGKGLIEDRSSLNQDKGDGSIRLASEDMEEIFATVITKPTFVLLVKDFHDARLPGIEVDIPTH
jgi:L,D-transpeptidase catalytic domain